jgi:signal transduction histidine kinase
MSGDMPAGVPEETRWALSADGRVPAADAARIQSERLDAAANAVGKLAHDVNNTLTVILGNAEYLLDSLADRPDLQEAARLVVAAAERGAELNRRVLLFSRRRGWQGAAVDPANVLRALGECLTGEAPAGIAVRIELPPALPPVALTEAALEEAASGLARNALEAMPGGGTLSISAVEEGAPGARFVAITIGDTGRGMGELELARSMEPFASRKPGGVGVGLGLAVAHGVARAAGGSLTLHSTPGEGTRAVLRLPVREG